MALAGQTFDPYRRGDAKIWYSTETVSPTYLQVLLRAETIFDAGLPAIEHGREEACYKLLMKGDIQAN